MSRVAAVLAVALLGAIAACGGDGGGRFDDDVAAVRDAVEAEDPTAAAQALDTLAVDALAAHRDGFIDAAELEEVVQLVEASRAEVARLRPATTTTTTTITTTTTTTSAPPPVIEDDHDDDGKPGKGNRGKGGDDEDD